MLLRVVPLAFNAAFALRAAGFDSPDILHQPTDDVLAAFRPGGTPLTLLWCAFTLTAVLLAPLVVLLSSAIRDTDSTLRAVTTTVGVLAALVQFLGLVRRPSSTKRVLPSRIRLSEAIRVPFSCSGLRSRLSPPLTPSVAACAVHGTAVPQ